MHENVKGGGYMSIYNNFGLKLSFNGDLHEVNFKKFHNDYQENLSMSRCLTSELVVPPFEIIIFRQINC